jgi:hypothetical protein
MFTAFIIWRHFCKSYGTSSNNRRIELPVGFYVLASDRRHRDFSLGLDLQKCLQIIKAVNIWILEYNNLSNSDEDWYCRTCMLPNFSDSYFDHNKSFDGTSDHEISYTHRIARWFLRTGF